MPGLDGLEATRQLRALQRAGRLQPFPIIASTAGDSGSSRRSCLDAGMDAYLGKPLSLTLLEAEMRRMLPTAPAG
jgi:CheY-like chemotaxis protein